MAGLQAKFGIAPIDGAIEDVSRSVTPFRYNDETVAWEHRLTIVGYALPTIPESATAADSLSLVTSSMQTIEADVILEGGGGIVFNNAPTTHFLSATGALQGVRVEDFQWIGTEVTFATEAKYQCTLSAIYGAGTVGQIELRETISIRGEGTTLTRLIPQALSQWVEQDVSQFSQVTVVQSGTVSSGSTTFPAIPGPLINTGRQVDLTQRDKYHTYKGSRVLASHINYGYTFHLPSDPGNINPNTL